MHFVSFLHVSVIVIVAAAILSSCDAAIQYVNGSTIFGRCDDFSIQAGTAASFDGVQTSVGTGDIGVAPGTAITGALVQGTGALQACTSSAINCAADELIAYGYLKGLNCTYTLANSDLSGVTLPPGIYCTGSGVFTLAATNLYLDAQGDADAQFIFQSATTVITAANTNIILLNGTLVKNIYWQVGTSVTLGDNSSFMGQILAAVSITVGSSVTVVGRLYAQAAVSCAGNGDITLPSQS